MAKKSKFMLRNGKSTGYAVIYYTVGEGWRVFRGRTKDEAEMIMNTVKQWIGVDDVAVVHVVDSWQRSYFDDETL